MKADYDPEADSLAIELLQVDRLDHGDQLAEGVIVHIAKGRPAAIDVQNASESLDSKLEAAAARHGLDLDALLGVGHTAVANPNRTVILEILQEQPA